MSFLIKHKRFYKNINTKKLEKFWSKKIIKYPNLDENYYSFFNNYAKKNYVLIDNPCLCKKNNDITLSKYDRHCVNFETVCCKECGLIRAKRYYRNEDVNHIYENIYRTTLYSKKNKLIDAKTFFKNQKDNSRYKYDIINRFSKNPINDKIIVDLGGGVGGVLSHFNDNNNKFLFDFYDPYLNYAKTQNINPVKGGLEKINFKPDIIILTHVIEHWNNFDYEIQNLIKIQKKNETLNYIEFPGIDSLREGRREGDILGDIHIPHVYYFASYVFENLMNRHGFKKIYLDSEVRSLFIYSGERKSLYNFYKKCEEDLVLAEKRRKFEILKKIIKCLLPRMLIKFLHKINKLTN